MRKKESEKNSRKRCWFRIPIHTQSQRVAKIIVLVGFTPSLFITAATHDNYIKGLTLTFLHGKLLKVDTTTISYGFSFTFWAHFIHQHDKIKRFYGHRNWSGWSDARKEREIANFMCSIWPSVIILLRNHFTFVCLLLQYSKKSHIFKCRQKMRQLHILVNII